METVKRMKSIVEILATRGVSKTFNVLKKEPSVRLVFVGYGVTK